MTHDQSDKADKMAREQYLELHKMIKTELYGTMFWDKAEHIAYILADKIDAGYSAAQVEIEDLKRRVNTLTTAYKSTNEQLESSLNLLIEANSLLYQQDPEEKDIEKFRKAFAKIKDSRE